MMQNTSISKQRTAVQRNNQRTSFKWATELHLKMAEYVKENYQQYRESLSSARKISFLRRMRDIIGFDCDDMQLKNGFSNFLKKYEQVKQKLNTSGFGIDPDKDASLNKGWILKTCPYFDILDEVMGSRPNITPPALVATAVLTSTNLIENMDLTESATAAAEVDENISIDLEVEHENDSSENSPNPSDSAKPKDWNFPFCEGSREADKKTEDTFQDSYVSFFGSHDLKTETQG